MSGLGISESTANGMVNWIRETSEEGLRWMFKVGAQSEWYVFAATVVGLWILSKIGGLTDLVTLVYIGIFYLCFIYSPRVRCIVFMVH